MSVLLAKSSLPFSPLNVMRVSWLELLITVSRPFSRAVSRPWLFWLKKTVTLSLAPVPAGRPETSAPVVVLAQDLGAGHARHLSPVLAMPTLCWGSESRQHDAPAGAEGR